MLAAGAGGQGAAEPPLLGDHARQGSWRGVPSIFAAPLAALPARGPIGPTASLGATPPSELAGAAPGTQGPCEDSAADDSPEARARARVARISTKVGASGASIGSDTPTLASSTNLAPLAPVLVHIRDSRDDLMSRRRAALLGASATLGSAW